MAPSASSLLSNVIKFLSFFLLHVTTSSDAFVASPAYTTSSSAMVRIRVSHHELELNLLSTSSDRKDNLALPYGERSRPYRRDLFDYDRWVKHRSSKDRFFGSLIDMLKSGIVRQLLKEVVFTTGIASFLVVFNALFTTAGYDDFFGIHHEAFIPLGIPTWSLPSFFFTLSLPALSFLLVFKTNTSYQRWSEGRKNWESIVNQSRTIMREGAIWVQPQNPEEAIPPSEQRRLLGRLAGAVWAFPRSMTRHLLSAEEDELAYCDDVRANLRPELAEDLAAARHRPARALYELSCAIQELPITTWRRCKIDAAVTSLCDAMGSNERIFTSPVPRSYTQHTARFMEIWLLLMPFTLYEVPNFGWNHIGIIPATLIISFFLLGIEELGIQLEEPFSVLPMHKLTNLVGLSAEDHLQWMDQQLRDTS